MKRADPVDMRKSLELVNEMKRAGLAFVPIPTTSIEDRRQLLLEAHKRLDAILKELSDD